MNDHRKAGPAEVGNPARLIASPAARLWLYGVVGAGLAVLLVYGVITEDELPRWLDLAAAILAPGALTVAAANVPARSRPDED